MRVAVWSNAALDDFDQALQYLGRTNPHAATLIADRIEAAVHRLALMPTGRPGRVSGTFEKFVSKTAYIIAYSQDDDAITVLRMIHASRDWLDESWPEDSQSGDGPPDDSRKDEDS